MTKSQRPILNVDDNEPSRYARSRVLQRAGYEVFEADTGAEALRLVAAAKPSLVLLDVRLPDSNGIEVCRLIKRDHPGTAVLQISSTFVRQEDRIRGLDGGADAYLVEPVDPLELVAIVRAVLRMQMAEHALREANETLEERVVERTRALAEATERLEQEMSERQKAEAALMQAQKMEAMGRLTGGMAHDFNNLLTAVIGNLDMIRTRTTDERILKWAERAHQGAMRGAKLTAQLLAFSREQRLTLKSVDVNSLIEGMDDLIDRSIREEINVRLELAPTSPDALTDATQLELAILNLVINARDAISGPGLITISSSLAQVAEGDPELRAGDYVVISVADTGSGMSEDVLARALEPFFTTKPSGKGTGLGLSQVYGIARQCKGAVKFVSVPGHGTTVRIFLPIAPRIATRVPLEASLGDEGGANEMILVVDDEPEVRAILAETLSEAGYRVKQAESAADALEFVGRAKPDLVLVDFAMPDRNGADLAREIRAMRKDLPIIFVSGYADIGIVTDAIGATPLVRKPFEMAELTALVRQTLTAARTTN
jgi:DNA-binding response OmpR family regulator